MAVVNAIFIVCDADKAWCLEAPMAVAESHPEPHAQPRLYRCYLLRCWLEEDGEADSAPVWRFTIRQAEPDAARRAFTSPGELAAYLQAELASYALTQNDG